jgi:tetratricopeptide (TPR) repeat protein
MKALTGISAAAIIAALTATAANSGIMVAGNSSARICYAAAARQSDNRADLRPCDMALETEGLTTHDRVATLVNRGIIYFHRAEWGRALTDFDAALAIDDDQPEAMLNKALTLLRRDRSGEQAITYFTRALELGTENPAVAHYGRGLAHQLDGDLTDAYIDIRRASDLAPEWEAPRNDLSNFIVQPVG